MAQARSVSGSMDQDLRSSGGLILTHTQFSARAEDGFWGVKRGRSVQPWKVPSATRMGVLLNFTMAGSSTEVQARASGF